MYHLEEHKYKKLVKLLEDTMSALDDLTNAITGLQTAVTDAIANAGNADNPTDDAAIESAVTTLNGLAAQLNSAFPAATTTPADGTTAAAPVATPAPVSSTPPLIGS